MVEVNQIYKHFKGNLYTVVSISVDANTQEPIINYKRLDSGNDNTLWSRTETNFEEEVNRDGYSGPRFVRLQDILEPLRVVYDSVSRMIHEDPILAAYSVYVTPDYVKLGDGVHRWSETPNFS